MMIPLWALVLVAWLSCFFCSNALAQMQEEGDTVTTVIESQGDVEEVTQTTVTVEHKTTGDILDGDTGIVTSKYEGDADIDWGGAGAIYSHASCTDAASGFPATGTDGRTVACGHAKNNSLTTWRQYVDLNSFDIKDGGEVNYEFLFAFPNSMYTNANRTAYVQTKGYNDNALQWETGLVPIDKTTFTQNPYNYNNNTNWVNAVTGSYDFANQLDKVYIEIGGYGTYYWDEFQYTVAYNHITTVVETWMQVVEQQQDLDTTMDLIDNYEVVDTFEQEIVDTTMEDFSDMDMGGDPEVNVEVDIPDVTDMDDGMMTDIPDTTTGVAEMFEDLEIDMPMMDMEEVITEVEEMVAEIQEIEVVDISPPEINEPIEMEPEIEEIAIDEPIEEISTPTDDATEPTEVVEVVEPTEEVEATDEPSNQDEQVEEQPAEETKDVADSEMETEEIQEEAKEETQSEEKEVAENEVEEKEIVEEKPKEEVKKTEAEEKSDKLKEKKQEKAKEIIENFASNYDAVAQITTLALVNALGPNIKTYSNQVVQPALDWYETEEIYKNVVMQDPLGNYISVKDSLTFNKMIDMQYD